MNPLNSAWTRHLQDPKDKQSLESAVRNSTAALSRLKRLLEDQLRDLDMEELADDFYELPNINERLIFNRGQRKNVLNCLKLLSHL
jgi:hypothetical protein